MRCLALLAAPLLLLGFPACDDRLDTPEIALTEAANGKTVTVELGQLIVLRLLANPTTGHQWRVTKLDGEAVVATGKSEYFADPDAGVAGGGMLFTSFRAAKPGKATLAMGYFPPGSKDAPPAATFAVTLLVRGPEPKKP